MESKGSHKSAELIVAFILGAVAGAIAGLLLAPDKGSETRAKFSDAAGSLADELKKFFGHDPTAGTDSGNDENGRQ